MSRCSDCRQIKPPTLWERFRGFWFRRFTTDVKDLRADSYTQGFSDGYKDALAYATERQQREQRKYLDLLRGKPLTDIEPGLAKAWEMKENAEIPIMNANDNVDKT